MALLFVAVFVFAVIDQVRNGLPNRSAMAANWTTFKHPLGFAQIDMPGMPTFNAMQSKNGAQTYSLSQRNYQMSLSAIQLEPNAQTAIATVPGAIDLMFAEMLRQTPTQIPGSTLISSRQMTAGSMRGLEMKVGVNGTINLMRFYVTPTAVIGAEFLTRNESTYGADRERFFNSFRGPDGNAIDGPAQPHGQAPSGAHAATAGNTEPPLAPVAKPTAPLEIKPPADALRLLAGIDLSKEDPRMLGALAQEAATQEKDFAKAVQLQFWSVKGTGEGQYNLACYLSRVGHSESAFYWLQVAALEEGVDSEWATQDEDLRSLRLDRRWAMVLKFLRQCNAYWATSQQTDTQLVMPAGVSPSEPIPVMIGLHGMGSSAKGFVDAESFQEIANQKRIAFLGVSGTIPRGPRSFIWSEDPVKDAARVDAALNEVKDRLTPKAGQLVLFGFSQGGMMSAEIAARAPDRYSGALVMSPGGNAGPQPAGFLRPANGRTLNAVCICGAGEHPGNVAMTHTYANLFRQAGARVIHKPYPNMDTHSFPPDFETQLPRWIDFLLGISPSA